MMNTIVCLCSPHIDLMLIRTESGQFKRKRKECSLDDFENYIFCEFRELLISFICRLHVGELSTHFSDLIFDFILMGACS